MTELEKLREHLVSNKLVSHALKTTINLDKLTLELSEVEAKADQYDLIVHTLHKEGQSIHLKTLHGHVETLLDKIHDLRETNYDLEQENYELKDYDSNYCSECGEEL